MPASLGNINKEVVVDFLKSEKAGRDDSPFLGLQIAKFFSTGRTKIKLEYS